MKYNEELRQKRIHSKQDFQELAINLIKPLIPHYTSAKAGLDIGETGARFTQKVIELEGFSRVLWMLAPYWCGGGESPEFEEIYQKGLCAGTDPVNKAYWGGFKLFDQRFVEMAAIGFGLLLAPDKLWEPLSDSEKNNLYLWLNEINENDLPESNWVMFRVIVNLAFKKLGLHFERKKMEEYLDKLEQFYIGSGWYQDGASGHKDYYVSFAIHFYCLIYIKEMREIDVNRCEKFICRAEAFGRDFLYWFDEDGLAIPYGRSLTYRFSQVSFYSACLISGVQPFSVGVMKGLISRHLKDWLSRPILDNEGILTIGYGYPNLYLVECYNSPGSPYWAMKAFVILLLPDEHDFWHVDPEPMPERERLKYLPSAEMLISTYPNHTTCYVPGKYFEEQMFGGYPEKYSKMAYDTKFSISMSKSNIELREAAPDSMLAFVIDNYIYVRRSCEKFTVSENAVYSLWRPYRGIEVHTTVIPTVDGHIRKHKIISEIDCSAYDCGFAVEDFGDEVMIREAENFAIVSNSWSKCKVISSDDEGKGFVIPLESNTNLLHTMTRIPTIRYQIHKGINELTTQIYVEYNRKW